MYFTKIINYLKNGNHERQLFNNGVRNNRKYKFSKMKIF